MFRRKKSQKHGSFEHLSNGNATTLFTIVGSDAKLEGRFEVADSVQIECEVGGRIKVGKKLVIGERGFVRADVEAVDVIIYGQYEGNMVVTGSAVITPTGRVTGSIATDSLVISKGGFLNGSVTKLTESESAQSPHQVSIHLISRDGARA